METEPLERTDEHQSGETPEDVAILYSWANLQGAKYRDFSANRREYRAQMRHRAAEQLRLMELRAQSEAEAAAAEAEAEAAAAHAEADAATVKLAVSRSMPALAPEEILKEREVEQLRRSSLREAAQQARRAAAERLEAARRAEAAALADSIARREEREIAEAQASALRQAAQYHNSELRSRQIMAQHPGPDDQVPGRITDPYSPQILPEGEYYDGPGTPTSELEASRFRTQREYIERSTGTELPKFRMPPLFDEDGPSHRERQESDHDLRRNVPDAAPRRLSEMDLADREYFAERQLREERNVSIPPRQWPGRQEQEASYDASLRGRTGPPAARYAGTQGAGTHDTYEEDLRRQRPEVVSRIPLGDATPRVTGDDRRVEQFRPVLGTRSGAGSDGSLLKEAGAYPGQAGREASAEPVWQERRAAPRLEPRLEAEMEPASEPGPVATSERDAPWQPRRSAPPPAVRPALLDTPLQRPQPAMEQSGAANGPQDLYSATPRPSGAWLRQISAKGLEAAAREEDGCRAPANTSPRSNEARAESPSPRPSVEATYGEERRSAYRRSEDRRDLDQAGEASAPLDQRPSGFRPPWLTKAQAHRPSGSRRASDAAPAEKTAPHWLYEPQTERPVAEQATQGPAMQNAIQNDARRVEPTANDRIGPADTLQATREQVASRWFALKGFFARADVAGAAERTTPGEKQATPMIAVYSLAGGVGKTSLVATLGRALSSLGEKVLLADATSHGLLPFYFGANELTPGVVRNFTPPQGSADAPVHMVSYDLDRQGDVQAQSSLFDSLLSTAQQVDRVLLDLNGSCGWLLERLAKLKPTVLVPVAADMNSIVSLQAVERRFASMQSADGQQLRPVYLLNQFDASLPLHLDLREVLRQQLGDRLLPFVIHRSAGISEALAEGMTIVDYDPDSSVTQDFLGLANWVRAVAGPGSQAGFRSLRWSER